MYLRSIGKKVENEEKRWEGLLGGLGVNFDQ